MGCLLTASGATSGAASGAARDATRDAAGATRGTRGAARATRTTLHKTSRSSSSISTRRTRSSHVILLTQNIMRRDALSVSTANHGSRHRVPGCGPPTLPPRTKTGTNTDPLVVRRHPSPECGDVTDLLGQ